MFKFLIILFFNTVLFAEITSGNIFYDRCQKYKVQMEKHKLEISLKGYKKAFKQCEESKSWIRTLITPKK